MKHTAVNRFWAFAPLAALAAIAAASIIVLTHEGPRETVSSQGLIGRAAPSYGFAPLRGGEPLTPAAFAGRAYVVNFFASWCAPCRAEHALLMRMKERDIPILGVAYKNDPGAAAGFLAELGDPYERVGLDPEGRYGLEIGLAGVPETFVVGPDGRIRVLHRGPLTEDIVRSRIIPALRRER
jgi:cytochrome c biogenesis protein CcmG/thiol:disulfide interchange protein DsbE